MDLSQSLRQSFGHAIRNRRGTRKQREVADAAGVDRSSWSQYENGRKLPEENLDKVAQGLDCAPEQLVIEALLVLIRDLRSGSAKNQDAIDPVGEPGSVPYDGAEPLDRFFAVASASLGTPSGPMLEQARQHSQLALRYLELAFREHTVFFSR